MYMIEDSDWNVYDNFQEPKWLQGCMLPGELKWHINEHVQCPGIEPNLMIS